MPLTPYPSIPPGFALIRLTFTLAGAAHDPAVLYGAATDPGETVAAEADEHFNTFATHWMADLSTSLTLLDCHEVRNIAGALQEGDSVTAPIARSTGGQPVPPNTALLVRKGTGIIGKHFRGRSYIPGLPASATDSAQANVRTTPLAAYQADATAWLTALTAETSPMYLLHRSLAVAPTLVTDLGVEALLATQSRRLRKVAHR
jgi:hypothetical protein